MSEPNAAGPNPLSARRSLWARLEPIAIPLAIVVAGLIVALAIDFAGGRADRARYQIAGDGRSVWRVDVRTGELQRCVTEGVEPDAVDCRRVKIDKR